MAVTLERPGSLWTLVLAAVAFAGVGGALLAYFTAPDGQAAGSAAAGGSEEKIRVPLFVDPNQVRPTPRFRFTFDPPEALAELRSSEALDSVVQGAEGDDLRTGLELMHWARRRWEPGRPSPYPPIDARIILRDIRRGFTGGFCAQYNYVLAQALQSFGIPARYVSLIEHEVIEIFLRDERRWVCLDPLYDTYYTDEDGRPLSVHAIHSSLGTERRVLLSSPALVKDLDSHLGSFRAFAVWLKNDHVSAPLNFTDLERYKVYFLSDQPASRHIPAGALATSEPLDLYPEG